MKIAASRTLLLLLFVAPFSGMTAEKPLSPDEKQILRNDAEAMMKAMDTGDATVIIAKTHPSLIQQFGGAAQFADVTKKAMEQFREMGIKITDAAIGEPTDVYDAGEERLCFVPKTSVIHVGSSKVRSITYLVAVQKRGADRWTYLDGSAFRENLGGLWEIFPKLQKKLKLPPNKKEVLEK